MRAQYKISPIKWIMIILVCFLPMQAIRAQRVFVVSETGVVQEVKQGQVVKKFLNLKGAELKKNRPVIIPNPLKIYIKVDGEFDPEEWYVHHMNLIKQTGPTFSCTGPLKKSFQKLVKFNHISDSIIEIEISPKYTKKISSTEEEIAEAKVNGNKLALLPDLAIVYDPSKNSKKEGKEQMYWFVKMSENDYDTDEVNWTQSQVEYSINEIIATKNTTKQLFASIEPQQIPQYAAQNGNVQYVIVQHPQPVVQNAVTPIEEPNKKMIESDIDIDVPYNTVKSENTFGLVIANEDYAKVASVPFAKKDGKLVYDYITRTLGVDKGHVTLVENATLNDMKYEFKRLAKIAEAYNGEAQLIVYYCGHGIPDEKNGNGYLLPVDGYGNDVSTAYSTQELYDFLGSLNLKKTILFMDACFSGAAKDGNMLVAARGIAIKNQETQPSGNLIAFSACQGDETAYPYKEKGHGLMTYYLLKKIQETKGNVTLGELSEYIVDNVLKTSIVTNGKSQTPAVSVSPNFGEDWKETLIIE